LIYFYLLHKYYQQQKCCLQRIWKAGRVKRFFEENLCSFDLN